MRLFCGDNKQPRLAYIWPSHFFAKVQRDVKLKSRLDARIPSKTESQPKLKVTKDIKTYHQKNERCEEGQRAKERPVGKI